MILAGSPGPTSGGAAPTTGPKADKGTQGYLSQERQRESAILGNGQVAPPVSILGVSGVWLDKGNNETFELTCTAISRQCFQGGDLRCGVVLLFGWTCFALLCLSIQRCVGMAVHVQYLESTCTGIA